MKQYACFDQAAIFALAERECLDQRAADRELQQAFAVSYRPLSLRHIGEAQLLGAVRI